LQKTPAFTPGLNASQGRFGVRFTVFLLLDVLVHDPQWCSAT